MAAQPVLYGIDESLRLLIVDPSDGSVEAIGEPLDFDLFGPCPAMAFGPPGLFAVCYDVQQGGQVLIRIDPRTVQAVRIEPYRLSNVTDIAFRSDGLLFGWQSVFPASVECFVDSGGQVIRIDTEDGSSVPVGKSGLDACEDPFSTGLAFDAADRLYLSYSQLGIVDQSSGKASGLMPFAISTDGLDFHPLDGRLFALGGNEHSLFVYEISTGELKELPRLPTTLTAIAFSPSPNLILANLVSGPAADEARFRSLLTMINRSGSTLQPAIEFFGNDGSKLSQEQGSTIEPQGTAILDLNSLDGFNGWAQVSWTASAEVQAAIEVALCGQIFLPVTLPFPTRPIITSVQSAVLPQAHSFTAPGVITPFRESAFAIVNPSASESALVEVHALRADGQSFDANEIHIPPRGRVSLLLFELLNFGKVFIRPPDRPIDYAGSIHIRSDLPIAVTGLTVLLPEGKWTGLPVAPTTEF